MFLRDNGMIHPASSSLPRQWSLLGLVALILVSAVAVLLAPGAVLSQSAPTVSTVAVTSDAGDDDTYILDDVIRITLTFSDAVDVTGSPQLKIDMDPAEWGEKEAAYHSGSGSSRLVFTHTVVEPNISTQGIAVLADSLELNSGSIKSVSSQADADLSHAGLGHDASHRVNWQASTPTVSGVAISSDAGDDDTYAKDDVIHITLTFSETVNVRGSPQLAIDMDPAEWGTKWAGYESGTGATSLTFAHTVVEPNKSTQGIAVLANTLELNSGAIQSASAQIDADLSHSGLAHDPNHKVDWEQAPAATTPTVTAVAVTSNAGDDDTYAKDDVIEVTLTFNEAVEVTGTPQLKIDMDPAEWGEKQAAYHSGSGSSSLVFTHTVVEPNISTQGIAVLENTLELNSGTIQSVASHTDAALDHAGLEYDPNHKVDWELEASNHAPTVNTEAEYYDWFTGRGNAPRGTLVFKPFHDIFSDPDGDELTYTASVPDHQSHLVETLHIRLDAETSGGELWDILFFDTETETDWKALTPPLESRPVVTVTLTATDPVGLSASVSGDFLVTWESYPEIERAVASGQAIELTFDWEVEGTPAPEPEQFTVKVVNVDGSTGSIAVSSVSVNGKVVTLGLASALAPGRIVTLGYSYDYSDDVPLQRAGGGDPAPGFSGQTVDLPLPELRVPVCDRTPEVRDALARVVGKDCADITAADLAEVDFIHWGYLEDITSLKSGDFEGLYNLEELHFRDHQLTTLPEDIFDDLHSLQELKMWVWSGPFGGSGGLTALPEDVFAGPSNLKRLDLSGNRLRTLPENVFDGLSSLQTLDLSYNSELTALPEDVFDGLSSLQTLTLYKASLTALPEDVFDGLASLQTLTLERNGLTELPEDAFDGLSGLQTLSVRDNRLSELPEDVFDGLSSLQTLNLSQNDLSTLPEDVFDGLSSLQTLNLYSNHLTALPEDVFDGLSSLQALDLSTNGLTALPEDVFDGLASLQTLILEQNGLRTALPGDVFDGLSSLQTLNLRYMFDVSYTVRTWHLEGINLSAPPEDLFDGLSSLQSLDLSTNFVTELPEDVFDGLSSLQTLNLGVNLLTALPEDVFDGLSSLQELDLRHNRLTELPEDVDVFDGLSGLQSLDLSANPLSELPEDVFDSLSSLQTLDLGSSDLTALPEDVFDGLSSLQTLTLSSSDLTALPEDVFDGLSSLQTLRLTWGGLTALPEDVFDGLSSLQTLDLDYNDLSELPVGVFTGLNNLQSLHLNNNALTTLSAEMFNNLPQLRELDLSDNPGSPFGLNLRSGIRVVE